MGALAIVPTREVPHRPEVVATRRRDDFVLIWLAVITTAVEDLFSPSASATHQDQSDAVHFLTDMGGAWAASRRDVATAAGIDPEVLREHVVGILEGADPPEGMLSGERGCSGKRTANLVTGVKAARTNWAQRLATDKETLERSRILAAEAAERRAKTREAAQARAARDAALAAQHEAAIARRTEAQIRSAREREARLGRQKGRAFFTLTPLEIGGLPYGQIVAFKQPWVFGDYCTVLDAYLPNPNAAAGRMLLEVTQPEALLCDYYADQSTRWESLRKIEAITGLTPLYFDKDGGPELKARAGRTMRLRRRP